MDLEENNVSQKDHSVEDPIYGDRKVKLKQPLDINALIKEGTVLEIDKNETEEPQLESEKSYFNITDSRLFNVIQTGRYCVNDEALSSDSDDEVTAFAKLASNMEDISGDGGVLKRMVVPGMGPAMGDTSTVKYKYSAYLEMADDPFDSSMFRRKPNVTKLAAQDVLLGLQIALKSMRERENAHFLIRPDYAYGKMGCPPRIPEEATLFYDITVLGVCDMSSSEAFEALTEQETTRISFAQKIKITEDYIMQGNELFNEKQYGKAIGRFRSASWVMEGAKVADANESNMQLELLFRIHMNSAQAHLNLLDAKGACRRCRDALTYSKNQPKIRLAKVYYRFAEANRLLHEYDQALKYVERSRKLHDSQQSRELHTRIARDKADSDKDHKLMCRKMFAMTCDDKPVVLDSHISQDFEKDVAKYIEHVLKTGEDLDIAHSFTSQQLKYIKAQISESQLNYSAFTHNNRKYFKLYR